MEAGRRSSTSRRYSKQGSSQQSSSRSGSISGSWRSSSQLRLRGSRNFLGSQTSLASISRRNLVSESPNLYKPPAQILDENGEDVTPQPLLGPDAIKSMKTGNKAFWTDNTPSESIFHSSGTTGSSFSQPFSASVMEGGSVMGVGSMSQLGSSLSDPQDLRHPAQGIEESEVTCVREEERTAGEKVSGEDEIVIKLTETETISLLDIPGSIVVDPKQQESVQNSNKIYQELLKNRPGNDRFTERGMQTIDNARKTKHVQTEPVRTMSNGTFVSFADMFDTYTAMEKNMKEPPSEASLEELACRAASRMTTSSVVSSQPSTTLPDTDSSRIPGESTFVASVFSQSTVVSHTNYSSSDRGLPRRPVVDPTQPNDHPILKATSLPEKLRILETAVMMNNTQTKLAIYRDLPTLIEHVPSTVGSFTISRGHLFRLWSYSSSLTRSRSVTVLAWSHSNPDVLAVGYDSPRDSDVGLVGCWSLKNSEFPNRVFHAPSGVTSLSFSILHPNLLAAGLSNGSILLYDVRTTQHSSILDSSDAIHKHCGPVWQVQWVLKERTLGEEARSEALVSTCTDGRVLQWSIRKGFESLVLMKLKRMVVPKPPMMKKQVKNNKKKKGGAQAPPPAADTMISHHAPGLGFDFSPTDPNIYLVCTEEGFVYKCSCSYNEQVLKTYKGHTGAVYRVRWSQFVTDIFISCSADWTVRLWHQDHTSPLLTFSSFKTPVYDVIWSPFHSAMFGCVSENGVEVWNLDINILDPVIQYQAFSSPPTSLSFSHNSQTLLVGEASGDVGVYQLKNVAHIADQMALIGVVEAAEKELHS